MFPQDLSAVLWFVFCFNRKGLPMSRHLTHEFEVSIYRTNKELLFLHSGTALKARWFLKSNNEMFVSIHAIKKGGICFESMSRLRCALYNEKQKVS